jgi:spermidine synthase
LIFAIESFGSLVGGVVSSFVLSIYVMPLTGAWALGLLTAANLFWFLRSTGRERGRGLAFVAAALALLFLVILITPLRPAIEQRSAALRHRAYAAGFEWIEERYTPYQHLALVGREGQFSLLSNGQFVATFPDPYATSQTAHLMMSQSETARRILLIGGGETGLIRALLTYPGARIDYLEIDPQILEIVYPRLDPAQREALRDPRVRIIHEDARRYVRRLRKAPAEAGTTNIGPAEAGTTNLGGGDGAVYDVILLNTPEPSTAALNRFYTSDFYGELRRLLKPRGVLATRITSSANYFDPEILSYVGSVYQALRQTFGRVLLTPGSEAVLFATAADDLLTSDVARLIARFERRGVVDPGFSPLYFHTAYEQGQLQVVNRTLRETLGRVRPNTDLEPVTYLYHLRLWNRFSGASSQAFFAAIERYDWRWAILIAVAFLLVRLATARWVPLTSARAAWRQGVAMLFATGFAGMAASILLLLLFQNHHGSLYREVGLLVALFMGGLTIGSLVANWGSGSNYRLTPKLGRRRPWSAQAMLAPSGGELPTCTTSTSRAASRLLGAMGLGACAFWLFLFVLEKSASGGVWEQLAGGFFESASFFHGAMIAAGILTGVQFPLVGRLAAVTGRDPGRAGGILESVDHLGACFGAFLTGVVLIPVSGVVATMTVCRTIEIVFGASLLLAAIQLARRS